MAMPPRPQRCLLLLALLAGVFLTAGCMQLDETTKITKDGTGTAEITCVVDLDKLDALRATFEGMGSTNGVLDPLEGLDPDTLKTRFRREKGVRIITADRTTDPDKHVTTVHVEVAFDSLEAFYRSDLFRHTDVSLEKLPNGNFKLTRKLKAKYDPGDLDKDEQKKQVVEFYMSIAEPNASGMQITATLTFPTRVVRTNGETVDANTVRWQVGFQDIVKADKRVNWVEFQGEGLEWQPFSTATPAEAPAEKTSEGSTPAEGTAEGTTPAEGTSEGTKPSADHPADSDEDQAK